MSTGRTSSQDSSRDSGGMTGTAGTSASVAVCSAVAMARRRSRYAPKPHSAAMPRNARFGMRG